MLGKDELLQLLDAEHIPYTCEEHEAVLNMADSDGLLLSLSGVRCKNLLLQDRQGHCFLVMTSASKSLDLTAAARLLGSRRLSFASAEVLLEMLGLRPGALSPLALINDEAHRVRLVIDTALATETVFLLHPLDNTATIAISREALMHFLAGRGHAPDWLALEERQAVLSLR